VVPAGWDVLSHSHFCGLRPLDELYRAAEASAIQLQGHSVDVTDGNSVSQLVESILKKDGRLDVLVNTVGAYAGGVSLWQMESDLFERMIALNLRSGYTLARAVVPEMLRQGHGSIVNVAAKAAFDHAAGAAGLAAADICFIA
jgi:NAD(P)-dependent dehydrogenase (short-subunit alcohol dehydrogenase family)